MAGPTLEGEWWKENVQIHEHANHESPYHQFKQANVNWRVFPVLGHIYTVTQRLGSVGESAGFTLLQAQGQTQGSNSSEYQTSTFWYSSYKPEYVSR